MVFVEVTMQPRNAAKNPARLKLSSVKEVSTMPPTTGSSDSHTRWSKVLPHTSHCNTTVATHFPKPLPHLKKLRSFGHMFYLIHETCILCVHKIVLCFLHLHIFSDVFKLLTLTIAVNISKDQVFYMLKPVLFCIADINQTFVN